MTYHRPTWFDLATPCERGLIPSLDCLTQDSTATCPTGGLGHVDFRSDSLPLELILHGGIGALAPLVKVFVGVPQGPQGLYGFRKAHLCTLSELPHLIEGSLCPILPAVSKSVFARTAVLGFE
jgi:hypothetical protein